MNKWEYKIVHRNRQWTRESEYSKALDSRVCGGTEWWYCDPNGAAMDFADLDEWQNYVNKLGAEGWELVAVEPVSDFLDANNSVISSKVSTSCEYAGFTSSDNWVFKRVIKK